MSKNKKRISGSVSRVDLKLLTPSHPKLEAKAFTASTSIKKKSTTDPLLDPAKQVLLCTQEAKKKRQQAELQLALDKIHQRVDYTVNEYEGPLMKTSSQIETANEETSIEVIEDPAYLYELLGDSTQRTKYQQKLTVFILGFEEKCENRERLLSSLQDFFLESQASGTETLLHELKSNEYDLDDATSGIECAMDTAQDAAQRLLLIKQEMSKLIAVVAAYPDTKKGRKKLEKALLKAQEDIENLSRNLEQVQSELEDSAGQVELLQKQIELKSQECIKLKTEADKVKLLQVGKEKHANELKAAQAEIDKLKQELEDAKSLVPSKSEIVVKTTTVAEDRNKIKDLETELAQERKRFEVLLAEKKKLQTQHMQELEAVRVDFDVKLDEIKGSYDKTLRKDDDDEGVDLLIPCNLEPDKNIQDGLGIQEELTILVGDEQSKSKSDKRIEETNVEEDSFRPSPDPVPQDSVLPLQPIDDHEATTCRHIIDEQDDHDAKHITGEQDDHEAKHIIDEQVQTAQNDSFNYPNSNTTSNALTKTESPVCSQNQPPQDDSQQQPLNQTVAPPNNPDTPPIATRVAYTENSGSGSGASAVRNGRGSIRARWQGSITGDGFRRESMATSALDKLQMEVEVMEKKHRQEIDDLKAKSRKTITGLRAQLVMAQNHGSADLEAARTEVRKLKSRVNALEAENGNLEDRLALLKSEKTDLSKKLLKLSNELEERVGLIRQLEKELEARSGRQTLVDTSTQWSEPEDFSGQMNVVPSVAQMYSVETILSSMPNVAVEDTSPVVLTSEDSLSRSRSMVMDNFSSNLHTQSSPLVSSGYRLSQSSQTAVREVTTLTHDHPVLVEWVKVCEGVRMLRDSLVEALSISGQFSSVVSDLISMPIYTMDRSQDVLSEVMSSRVSISLLLNKLTLSLATVLTELTTECERVGSVSSVEGVGSGEEEMKVMVERLKRKLKDHKKSRHLELEESKDKIASLSCQVSSLRSELASLKQSLTHSHTDGDRVVMFTRLDSQRNTHTLKTALEKNKISSSAYNKVIEAMNDYLAIAGQGLASLSQQLSASKRSKQLANHIQHHYGPTHKASEILDKLSQLEQMKKLEFSVRMDRLRLRRLNLANTLTHTLQHIEKHSGVFFIKPVFYKNVGLGVQSMIYPITRPLPVKRTSHSQAVTPHPNMRLVSGLIRQRKSDVHVGVDERSRHGDETNPKKHQQMSSSPHTSSTHHTPPTSNTSHSPHNFPGNKTQWSVESSLPGDRARDYQNPLAPSTIPIHSKLMEIDIRRHRHHQTLFRDILPCPHQLSVREAIHRIPLPPKSVSPPVSREEKEEEVAESQLKVIPSKSSDILFPITMKVEFDFPGSTRAPLPPIDNC